MYNFLHKIAVPLLASLLLTRSAFVQCSFDPKICYDFLTVSKVKMRGLVLALVLGSASAFIPNSPAAKRAAARVQASDPWFPDAVATVVPNTVTAATSEYSESFLEASPYTDQSNIPVNTYKAKVRNILRY